MDIKKVYIVLLNWNGSEDTIECIQSLKKLDYENFQILLLDNGSSKESLAHLAEGLGISRDFPMNEISKFSVDGLKESLILYPFTENHGFSRAHNYAFEKIICDFKDGHYIWILNNDTKVYTDSLTPLVNQFYGNKKLGLCGSIIAYSDRPQLMQCYGGGYYYKRYGMVKLVGKQIPVSKRTKKDFKINYLMGASILADINVMRKVKGFDEDFFMYFEDLDLSFRVLQMGYEIDVASESIILHKDSGSMTRRKYFFYYLMKKHTFIFIKKHFKHISITQILFNLAHLIIRARTFKNLYYGLKGIFNGISIKNTKKK
ncbi:glycosyltransferase family 2 protein [Salinivirga cyanobacteriivorans]